MNAWYLLPVAFFFDVLFVYYPAWGAQAVKLYKNLLER